MIYTIHLSMDKRDIIGVIILTSANSVLQMFLRFHFVLSVCISEFVYTFYSSPNAFGTYTHI